MRSGCYLGAGSGGQWFSFHGCSFYEAGQVDEAMARTTLCRQLGGWGSRNLFKVLVRRAPKRIWAVCGEFVSKKKAFKADGFCLSSYIFNSYELLPLPSQASSTRPT